MWIVDANEFDDHKHANAIFRLVNFIPFEEGIVPEKSRRSKNKNE